MSTQAFSRHLRLLGLAHDCVQFGARLRTIEILTGLSTRHLHHLLRAERRKPPRGRPPNTPEWYHGGTLLDRSEACVFACIFRRLRDLEFEPARALLGAYRHYRQVCWHAPRVSFDRAFDLARQLDGIWQVPEACLSLATCPQCSSQYLAVAGASYRCDRDCPFCKLTARYAIDPRVQSNFPAQPLPDPVSLQWPLALRAQLQGLMA